MLVTCTNAFRFAPANVTQHRPGLREGAFMTSSSRGYTVNIKAAFALLLFIIRDDDVNLVEKATCEIRLFTYK